MSVEMIIPAGEPGRDAERKRDRALRSVVGVLDDGTAFYAPIGEIITDGTRVICHLCGRSLRSVTAHLRAHGWTKLAYCDAFGLERGQSLEGPETRKRRWLSRHLADVDPAAADAARQLRADRMDARWVPVLSGLGFADVASYLRERHLMRHWSVNARATEIGFSNHTVNAPFGHHGLAPVSHASKRHAARQRAERVAQDLGYQSVADYISRRRTHGRTWKAIAAASGQPESWLRRHSKEPQRSVAAAEGEVDG